MTPVLYNCKHSGDQYLITKFDRHGEVESSYLCDHGQCQCPAGVRDTCRHRQMLPMFLEEGLVNTNLFINWNRRSITDFNGLPAVPPPHDLAPQALTDTGAQSNEPAIEPPTPTQEQLYNRAVIAAGGSITTNFMQDGSVESFATIPNEPAETPDQALEAMATCDYWNGHKSLSQPDPQPATPTKSWRRF